MQVTILAEICDKLPSIGGIIAAALIAASVCVALAVVSRFAAWSMLFVTLLAGGLLSSAACDDAFVSGPMRDDVWRELGWTWVLADITSPLLPAVCVAGVLLLRRGPTQGRGFPVDDQPRRRRGLATITNRRPPGP